MTNEQLRKLLKKFPKDLVVLHTFINKKKKVLASETSAVRIKVINNEEYLELIHCEDQDTHEKVVKDMELETINETIH